MATKFIDELTALTAPAGADLLAIEDVSATETKKITLDDLWGPISIDYSAPANSLVVDASGNVGIGTASPGAKADVDDGAVVVARFGDSEIDAGTWARSGLALYKGTTTGVDEFVRMGLLGTGDNLTRFWLSIDPDTSSPWNNTALAIDSNGNVGIGTASPLRELEVNGDVGYDGRLLGASTSSDGSASAPAIAVGFDYDTGFFRPAVNTIGITTGGVERIRINAIGNVGFGTATPATGVDIQNGALTVQEHIQESEQATIANGATHLFDSIGRADSGDTIASVYILTSTIASVTWQAMFFAETDNISDIAVGSNVETSATSNPNLATHLNVWTNSAGLINVNNQAGGPPATIVLTRIGAA